MSAKPTVSSSSSSSSSSIQTSKIVNMSNFNTNTSNSSSNANAVNNSGNGSTKMASRRIFPPEFKLKVLESYHTDAECKGNQRATARKYGIHRRQIQKWLQSENILRLSITNSYRNVKQFHNVTIAAATNSTGGAVGAVGGATGTGVNQSQNAKHHDICSGGISPNDSNNNDSNNNVNSNSSGSSFGSIAMAGVGVVQASSILSRRKQFSIPKRDQTYHGHHHHHHQQHQYHQQQQLLQSQQHPQQSSFKINLVPSPDKGRQNVSFIPLSGKFRTPQCAGASVVPDEKVKEGVAGKNVIATTIKQEVMTTSLSSSLSLALEPVVSNVATLSSHHHRHYQQQHQQQHQQQQRQSSEDLSATQVVAAAVPVHQQQAKQQSPIHPSVLSIEQQQQQQQQQQQNLEMRHKSGSSDTDSGAINTSSRTAAAAASPHPIHRSPDRLFSTTTTTTPYSFTSLQNYSPQYQPFFHQFRQDESYQTHHLTSHHQHHHTHTQLQTHEIPYKIVSSSSSACLPCTAAAADTSPVISELRDYQPISVVSSTAKTANYALVVGKGSMPSTNYFDVKRETPDTNLYFPATPIDLSLNNASRHETPLPPQLPQRERFYSGMSQLEANTSCSQCTPAATADSFIHNQATSSLPSLPSVAATSTSFTCCQSSSSENYATTSHHTSNDDALNLTQYERRKRHASNDNDNDNDDDDDNDNTPQRGNMKIAKLSPNDTAMKVKQEPKEQPQKPVKLFKPYALDNEDKDADSIKKTDTSICLPDNQSQQMKMDINETKTKIITTQSSNDKNPIIWNNHPFSMIPPPLHNNRDCYSALVPRQTTASHELSSVASSSFHGTNNNNNNNNEFTFPIIETRPALFQCSLPHTTTGSTNGSLASSNTSLSPTTTTSSSSSSSTTPPATATTTGANVCWRPKCSPAATSGYDSASGYSDTSDPIFHGSITPPTIIPHHNAINTTSRSLLPSPGTVRLVPETQPLYSVDFKLEPLYYYYDSTSSISPTSSTSSAAASPTFAGDMHHVPHWNTLMTNKLSLMAK